MRDILTIHGYTARELKTLGWTSPYSFAVDTQNEAKRSSLIHGRWAEQEINTLKEMYEDHVHLRIIANRLGRMERSAKAKIVDFAKYFQARNELSIHRGPQALSPALEDAIFYLRFMTICEGLSKLSMTKKWDETFSNLPPESCIS